MNRNIVMRLMIPFACFLLFLLPAVYWDTVVYEIGWEFLKRALWVGRYVFGICLWLAFAWLTTRVLDAIVWPLVFERRLGYTVPRLLKDLMRLVVITIAVGVIISVVFEKSLTGFLAASGVLGLVLGFALQNMIADFFAGIALNLERAFVVGDRIELESGDNGEVMEINWRTTVLRTLPGNQVVIPNSKMGAARIENYDKPKKPTRQVMKVCLGFNVPTARALRILRAAVTQAQAAIDDTLEAFVFCSDITERGVEYRVVFTAPQYPYRRMRSEVIQRIMDHLTIAGIRPVYPQYDIYRADMPLPRADQQPDPYDLIQRIPLFTMLDQAEMISLAARLTPQLFTAGDAIVVQGAPGSSMYIIAEGVSYVYIAQENAEDLLKVAEFGPGQFMGEMAMLTGEVRSATVKAQTDVLAYEVTKEDMEMLFDKRPEIAESLSQVMAQRLLERETFMQNLPAEQQTVEVENFASQLLSKMRGFFIVFRRPAMSMGASNKPDETVPEGS